MQFTKKTSRGSLDIMKKFLIKVFIAIFLLILAIFLINKINFPAPSKKIEKVIPNENFKTIK